MSIVNELGFTSQRLAHTNIKSHIYILVKKFYGIGFWGFVLTYRWDDLDSVC